jgi:hypothetical protein
MVNLPRARWLDLRSFLDVPNGLTQQHAHEIRHSETANYWRIDPFHFRCYSVRPSLREALAKYCEDRLVLPYGTPRGAFDAPNPVFFYHYRCGIKSPILSDFGL